MDDPWDVKSVRYAGQYTSCMKINGIPLLPPVLSKECREEMQYYKLLAKEVEKRISILEPYSVSNGKEALEARSEESSTAISQSTSPRRGSLELQPQDAYNSPNEEVTVDSSQLVVDFSLCINQTKVHKKTIQSSSPCPPEDLPERDYNCTNRVKELLLDTETNQKPNFSKSKLEKVDISLRIKKNDSSDSLSDPSDSDGLKSMASKYFTGSLNDIYTNSSKEHDSKLSRQRSYTILNPSPQLLAHLEVQSLNTGVEMSNISMSESLSNVNYNPHKKRRSWDLESAKVKWSSLALELKQNNITNKNKSMQNSSGTSSHVPRSRTKTTPQLTPTRARSVADKRPSSTNRSGQKSEPIKNTRKRSPLPNIPSNRTIVKEPIATRKTEVESPKSPKSPKSPPKSPKHLPISNGEDPAMRVRELYEKIQKQQLLQMANLVEKQKREQLLLQQFFEEQNNLLFKQLKTICPTSSIEAKEAWGEKHHEAERGPVSLSQLINQKPHERHMDSPASTLTNMNNYIDHLDNVLNQSRNVSSTRKPITPIGRPKSSPQSPKSPPNGSRTRTHSPNERSTISRRLNYETSASSDRELEPMLTDRTNDTMADVNVTFPSDSDVSHSTYRNQRKETSVVHAAYDRQSYLSTDSAIRSMERTIQNSLNSSRRGTNKFHCNPTPEQRAAASVIVAHARGYLVRRLFRTERVQSTVQTIKDALLCALQLHQDREGIRGADVDLHRRLIQQITAACYSLHDTFIASSAAERCAMIAADRERRRLLANRPPVKPARTTSREAMSQSCCGSFPARPKRSTTSTIMSQSTYENYNSSERPRSRYMPSPRPRPWR